MPNIGGSDYRSIAINVLSSLIWYALGLLSAVLLKPIRYRILRRRIRVASERSLTATLLLTVSGSRFELTRRQLSMKVSCEEFKIAVPDQFCIRIRSAAPDFSFGSPIVTPRVAQLMREAMVEFPEIDELLASAAMEVAGEFINRIERLERLFNGDLFHILNFSNSATNDEREDPVVSLEFYKTDYFTHQVLHKAFTYIRDRSEVSALLEKGHITPPLRLFLNGFGLNCMVCACPSRKNLLSEATLILARRSARVAKNVASGTWHVTANEALSTTDVEDQRISIDRWIRRALDEEAGIRESEIVRTFIFNVVIGLADMQPGMLCLVMCELEQEEVLNRVVGSQDGMIEFDGYHSLPFNDRAISEALDRGGIVDRNTGHVTSFSPGADNILRNILARGTSAFV